eukprot:SAG22_NODE_165_length_16780_cov_57.761525_8_plen_229_part_00
MLGDAAYTGWLESGRRNHYALDNFLSVQALQSTHSGCAQLRRQLRELGLVDSPAEGDRYDENAKNPALLRALLGAALYPNIATLSGTPARGEQAAARLEIRTADLFSRKASSVQQKQHSTFTGDAVAEELLGGRKVALHPSSVLKSVEPKLAGMLLAEAARGSDGRGQKQKQQKQQQKQGQQQGGQRRAAGSLLVFHGRIKTSQVCRLSCQFGAPSRSLRDYALKLGS